MLNAKDAAMDNCKKAILEAKETAQKTDAKIAELRQQVWLLEIQTCYKFAANPQEIAAEENRTRHMSSYEAELAKAEEQLKRKMEVNFRHKGNLEVLMNEMTEKQQDYEKLRQSLNATYWSKSSP